LIFKKLPSTPVLSNEHYNVFIDNRSFLESHKARSENA